MRPSNPCFDFKTKTDCPNRKPECGATCEKWKEYVSKRNDFYELKEKERKQISGEIQQKSKLKKPK